MRAYYVFLAVAASFLAASDAISASKIVASTAARASIGRSLRVQGVVEYDEERTGADIKALVKSLLKVGATKSESFHISDDLNVLEQVETKVLQKQAKMVDALVAQGWTPKKMDDILTKPSFLQSLRDNDISDEGVSTLRDLVKAKFPTEV